MHHTNTSGGYIFVITVRMSLNILLVGNVSIFRRPRYAETIPDIPLTSEDIVTPIFDWRVVENDTASDNQIIISRPTLLL